MNFTLIQKNLPEVYLCGGGAGTAIDAMAGAYAETHKHINPKGYSGVSASALLSCGYAFKQSDAKIYSAIKDILTNGKIIKLSNDSWERGGILDWNVIGEVIDQLIGKNVKIGDSPKHLIIGVSDLDRGRPLYISSENHPHVLIREALQASTAFMCGITPACQIPSLSTAKYSPDIRLFADGGWTDNTTDSVFDIKNTARVLLRLRNDDSIERVRKGDLLGIAKGVLKCSLYAANQIKSKQSRGLVVDVDAVNNWNFKKTPQMVDINYNRGIGSVRCFDQSFQTLSF